VGALAGFPPAASAQPVLFVTSGLNTTIGEYNALTGATINPAFVNGQGMDGPFFLAADGNNHLFVSKTGALPLASTTPPPGPPSIQSSSTPTPSALGAPRGSPWMAKTTSSWSSGLE
jgi:hypothetical protein